MVDMSREEREELKKQYGLTDEQLDDEIAKAEESSGEVGGSVPMAPVKEDVLKFLRDVLDMKKEDNLRMNHTGNLNNGELGNLPFSVRKYNDLANYANLAGYSGFVQYALNKNNIVITTSTSRKGFFLQLITTNRRISKNIGAKKTIEESSLFGGSKKIVEGGDEE